MNQQYYYNSTQFITELQGVNYFQQFNIEILNYTTLNFARPDKPTDSHTAAMTAERRKMLDQLPRLNTDVNKKSLSRGSNNNIIIDKSRPRPTIVCQSPDRNKNPDVTHAGAHVKFVLEPDKLHSEPHSDIVDPDYNDSSKAKHKLSKKFLRRVSAPAQGIDYYFKQAKDNGSTCIGNIGNKNNKNNKKSLNIGLSIPSVHVEADESVDDNESNQVNDHNNHNNHNNHHHHHHHHHNHNHHNNNNHDNHDNHNTSNSNSTSMSSSIASVSSIASQNPPSLSPCSSTSSISSSIDMLSPTIKQPNYPQPYSIKTKLNAISDENLHAHSLPDIASDPYGEPWSPAAMFLSQFAIAVKQPAPDEEGQQVGEYILGKVIGRGGFSTVKKAYTMDQHPGTMKTVAVKIVKNQPDSIDNDRVQALLEREIAIWRRLDHPNIVPMLSMEEIHYGTFVFSEYCPGGTLLDYIKKHGKGEGKGLHEDDARNIFLQVAEGMRYLHNDVRLVHKDIKLDNILLDEEGTWRICDFGLTEFQNSVNGFDDIFYSSMVGGSVAYCAPEQLRSPTPLKDPEGDVWSLGVVLFAMVTGQLPFSDSFEPRLQFKIINGRYDQSLLDDSGASDDLRDLLSGMFKTKSDQRLTISEILEHRWCERW